MRTSDGGSGERVSPPAPVSSEEKGRPAEGRRDIAEEVLEEIYEDLQSGDILGVGGFVPHRLADYYLSRIGDGGGGNDARIDELAERLVDRILVTSSSKLDADELQMKLVGEVFDGAEIWMRRERGELRLDVSTSTEKAHDFLQGRSGDLAATLRDRLDERVRVVVTRAQEQRLDGARR